MSVQQILNESILAYVRNPLVGYAINLDGGWGEGKSHYVNHELSRYLNEQGCDCLRISLFGLSSKRDIEDELLGTFAMLREGSVVDAFKDATAKLSFRTEDNVSVSASLVPALMSTAFNIVRENKLKRIKSGDRDVLFVFDDLERYLGDITIPMAYVSKLIEQAHAKCLIICNTDGFLTSSNEEGKEKFGVFREKVIGRTLQFRLTAGEIEKALLQCVKESDDIDRLFQEMMVFYRNWSPKPFSEYRNIRNIQKAAYMISDLVRCTDKSLLEAPVAALHIFNYGLYKISSHEKEFRVFLDDNVLLPEFRRMVESWLDNGYVDLDELEQACALLPSSKSLDILLDSSISNQVYADNSQRWCSFHEKVVEEMQSNRKINPQRLFDAICSYLTLSQVTPAYVDRAVEFLEALDAYLVRNYRDHERSRFFSRWSKKHSRDSTSLEDRKVALEVGLEHYVKSDQASYFWDIVLPKIVNLDRLYG